MGLLGQLRRLLRRPPRALTSAPEQGAGEWRTVYGECCDAVLAYDGVVATLDPGTVQDRLRALSMQLPPLLAVAERLAEIAEQVSPDMPRGGGTPRDRLSATPADQVMARLVGLRGALGGIADDAARVAVRLRADPDAGDVAAILTALGAGLAEARRHGWTPIEHADMLAAVAPVRAVGD